MYSPTKEMISRYAEVAVKVGLKLQKGQELIINAPIEAVDLVRAVTKIAYNAGAKLVTTFYGDDTTALMRYTESDCSQLDYANGWLARGIAEAFGNGAARLAIIGDNPTLFKDVDPAHLSTAGKARGIAYKPLSKLITDSVSNWSIVAFPTQIWADQVFPGDLNALEKLWDNVLKACRCDSSVEDPIQNWEDHNERLHERSRKLNDSRFQAIRFVGDGTDLMVGLADNHVWEGGSAPTVDGRYYNANIPTEEVFTTPHSRKVDGFVKSTKPLLYRGTLIDGIRVRFEGGKAVEVTAEKGEQVFRDMINEDENACRLGEVALVPANSPISNTGILFQETLFDENASCHLAFGQSYSKCMIDTPNLTDEEREKSLKEWGANSSRIHTDWMIGSDKVTVMGVKDSKETILIENGEWVF
mgnify:CR=1 FL=1